jgi:hypothetical protein
MKIRRETQRYLDAVRNLSCLGRTQFFGLIASAFCSTAVVMSDAQMPVVMRSVAPAFSCLTALLCIFAMVYEDPFAFGALVVLLMQHATFLIGSVVLVEPTAPQPWVAVGFNLSGLLLYAGVQIFARGTWGWHAFRTQLTSTELINAYRRVQALHAALLFAFANALLALICVICLPRDTIPWLRVVLMAVSLLYTVVAGPIVAHCVHRDDQTGALVAGCLSLVACAAAAFSAVTSFNEIAKPIHIIPVALIWFSAGCHLLVVCALVALRGIFGTSVMLSIAKNRNMETVRLIDGDRIAEESVQRQQGRTHHEPTTVAYQTTLTVPVDDADAWTSDDER